MFGQADLPCELHGESSHALQVFLHRLRLSIRLPAVSYAAVRVTGLHCCGATDRRREYMRASRCYFITFNRYMQIIRLY